MKDSNLYDSAGAAERVVVRETVDGIPVGEAAAAAPRAERAPAAPVAVRRPDTYIWGIYLLLLLISIVELYSASSTEIKGSNVYAPLIRHGIFLGLGFLIVLGCQNVHYSVFRKLAWPLAIISLVLLGISTFAGVEINGAQRAIQLGSITIQPPEIVKLTVVLLLVCVLARYQVPGGVSAKGVGISAVIVIVFGALVLPNGLTNLIIMMGASVCMLIIGGVKIRQGVTVLLVYLLVGGVFMFVRSTSAADKEFDAVASENVENVAASDKEGSSRSFGRLNTQMNRVARHIRGVKPTDEIDDFNRQVILSKFAMAHGGVWGRGPGNSRESARLPLAFSDYIFSIIIEDAGLVGGLGVLFLYICLIGRAGMLASKCSRAFPALLIMGCALLIVLQALIHMAIVTGVAPVSGQPLPLISKGGTSIIVMSMAIGMMLSVSRYGTTRGNKKEQRAEMNQLPEEMQAANPMQMEN